MGSDWPCGSEQAYKKKIFLQSWPASSSRRCRGPPEGDSTYPPAEEAALHSAPNSCPSCHARRLAEWSVWLDERLLAPVPHRQVVLTLPKRLRAFFLYDRRRLGLLSRVAARTLRDYVQAAPGERAVVPRVIVCVQTFGSVAHLHPHLHVLMTDGGFRRDGTFVPLPTPEPAVLEEAWRRAVLAAFVCHGWLEEDAAVGMLGIAPTDPTPGCTR